MAAPDSPTTAASALAVVADTSENQQFVNRNLSTLGRKSGQRPHFWAMSICGHCRCHAPTTKVFTCYGMKAHHREVVSVDAQGARESVGILSPGSELLMLKDHALPASPQAGTVVDLDPNSKVEPDDKVTFLVSCEECAGLPLGECINKAGHVQQERPASGLPAHCTRRVRQPPLPRKTRKYSASKKAAARGAKQEGGGTKKAAAGVGEARWGGGEERKGGGNKKTIGADSPAAAAATTVQSSSDERGKGRKSGGGKATSKFGARITAATKTATGAEEGRAGGGARKRKGVGGRGARVGGKQKADKKIVGGDTRKSGDGSTSSRGVSCDGANDGGNKSSNVPRIAAAPTKGWEEQSTWSRKRSRSPPNESISGGDGGGSSEGMRSPSSSWTSTSGDGRKQSLRRPPRGTPGEEEPGASARKSLPKSAKAHGIGSAGSASAPKVVETFTKSVSRVEDAEAPVLVSATDGERGVIVMNLNTQETRGGGGIGAGEKSRDNPCLITTTRVPIPPKRKSSSGGSEKKVVSPSSASSVVSSSKVLEKSSPTPALTAKALKEGGDSDAAQRTSSPSSSSSSCSFSSSTSSMAVEDPTFGVGRSSSGGNGGSKRRRNERSGEQTMGLGAVTRGPVRTTGEEGTSSSSSLPLRKKRKQGRSEQISASTRIVEGPTTDGRTAGENDGVAEGARKEKEGVGVEGAGEGGGVMNLAESKESASKQSDVPDSFGTAAAVTAVGVGASPSSSAFVTSSPTAPVHAHAGAIAPVATAAAAPTTDIQPTQPMSMMEIVSSVASAAGQPCPQKKVQLMKFLECQKREIEPTKKACREEVKSLEAQLEALKCKLREKMKDAREKQTKERQNFCVSLYDTEDVAAAAIGVSW